MTRGCLVVTFDLDPSGRRAVADALGGAADIAYLSDARAQARGELLSSAAVVLARNTAKELEPGEPAHLARARLIQFVTAGVDFIPLGTLPDHVPIAVNAGGYAEPMAEHALAMALAAAKRLFIEHAKLARGEFDQFRPNRLLAGATLGVLGFGGIGVATARLMRTLGMRVHAINRRGATEELIDWIATPDRLDDLLEVSDVLVLSLPLTHRSQRLIGARELALMKKDAILINLARGEIVDEGALFAHLQANPAFTACIDAWWVEPIRHGAFRMDQPFLQLPNVIGSPHNSASVSGWNAVALRRAVANCRRALEGRSPLHLIGAEERML